MSVAAKNLNQTVEVERTVVPGSFTIVRYNTGAIVSFNHETLNIRYVSASGAYYDTPFDDDKWAWMMNDNNLWRKDEPKKNRTK